MNLRKEAQIQFWIEIIKYSEGNARLENIPFRICEFVFWMWCRSPMAWHCYEEKTLISNFSFWQHSKLKKDKIKCLSHPLHMDGRIALCCECCSPLNRNVIPCCFLSCVISQLLSICIHKNYQGNILSFLVYISKKFHVLLFLFAFYRKYLA